MKNGVLKTNINNKIVKVKDLFDSKQKKTIRKKNEQEPKRMKA